MLLRGALDQSPQFTVCRCNFLLVSFVLPQLSEPQVAQYLLSQGVVLLLRQRLNTKFAYYIPAARSNALEMAKSCEMWASARISRMPEGSVLEVIVAGTAVLNPNSHQQGPTPTRPHKSRCPNGSQHDAFLKVQRLHIGQDKRSPHAWKLSCNN